jgi:predicted ATPase/DNA-binding SARP family transcriptional activator
MRFRVLGPLEVEADSGPVVLGGPKERRLLAQLLVRPNQVVPVETLVRALWGAEPPKSAPKILQAHVVRLRHALEPDRARGAAGQVLVTRDPGYLLQVASGALDATRFEALAAQARRALAGDAADGAAAMLREALGLWRGQAFEEFLDTDFGAAEADRLAELRLVALEDRIEADLRLGRHRELVAELEGLVHEQPLRERLWAQLMLALYRSGRQADALLAYQRARSVLVEELGIDPGAELQRLHQAILVQDPALDAAAPERDLPRHNLPERLTSLVGRNVELGELAKLVEQHRLVTVIGPGGAGKTSLAVALAERLVAGHPDGVWLVELAALRDPTLLAEAVAVTLGLSEEAAGPGIPLPAERLATFAADKAMLLVLDNCEHLVGACTELVGRLLQAGPRVRVLATSREVLGVPGEVVWPIPPLAVPDPAEADDQATAPEVLAGFDAVRLFVERATSAHPGFALDTANAPVVAELCRRLDGLPLAIELAAARVRALPPVELAARLEDRFRLLAGGARALDPRQQTLRATVDWSWDLLEERDRRLLRRLSVFSGGWTVAAAEAVCGGDGLEAAEVLDGLFRLVDRSLVVAAGGDPARFTLLETLRAYGTKRLAEAGEAEAVAARHTAWCLALAEQAATHRTARPWLRRVAADYDNLQAALDRAMAAPDPDTALRLASALGWYWWTERTIEGRQRLAAALALADGQPPTPQLARTLQAAAMVEFSLSPTSVTAEQARRSLELFERFGDGWGAAFSKLLLAFTELQRVGPGEDGARLVEEAEVTFVELGDPWGEAFAGRARFSFESYHRGPSAEAEQAGQRALAQFGALGDQWGLAQTYFSLAEIAKGRGDVDGAVGGYEAALAAARDGGPLWVVMASLVLLGSLLALRGDDLGAAALHAEAAALFRRTGQRRGFAPLYNELGGLARIRGDLERARQLHREALSIERELVGWGVPESLAWLACAEARLGDLDAAEAHLAEAAGLLLAVPQPEPVASVLLGAALVAVGHDRPEEAARLLAAAEAVNNRIGVTSIGVERHEAGLVAEAVQARLDPDALAAAQAAGRALAAQDPLQPLVATA